MSRKGTLTGGYYDTRRSRLEMQRQMLEQKERLEAAERDRAELRHQLEHIPLTLCVCVRVCVCVRACVRACVCVCVLYTYMCVVALTMFTTGWSDHTGAE